MTCIRKNSDRGGAPPEHVAEPLGHLLELASGDDPAFGEDAQLFGNRRRGDGVVAGDHHAPDPRIAAGGH